jgi:NAD(P)H-hydrate repair Nnr-like enzyme with NAD(P)H-hydrate dehydratase domain
VTAPRVVATPPQIAATALWLHGRAAELGTVSRSPRSLIAGDLLDALGLAMAELESRELPERQDRR